MYGFPAGFYEKADKAGIFMMSRLKSVSGTLPA